MLYNLPQMHLKKFQEKQFKKLLKQLGTLLVIKLAIKLQKSQKTSPHNSDAVDSEVEIPKESYTPPKKRQQIIDDLR